MKLITPSLILTVLLLGIPLLQGCATQKLQPVTEPIQPQTTDAQLSVTPKSGNAPLTVSFSYSDHWGRPSQINFGDGSIGDRIHGTVKHTYASPGTFTVTLTGCDPSVDRACVDMKLDSVTITVT